MVCHAVLVAVSSLHTAVPHVALLGGGQGEAEGGRLLIILILPTMSVSKILPISKILIWMDLMQLCYSSFVVDF